jgi:hypothetical protein
MSDGNGLDPHYILVVEFSQVPTDAKAQTLADRFEAAVCDANSEYHDKRASKRLGPAILRVTTDPVFAAPHPGARDFIAKPDQSGSGIPLAHHREDNPRACGPGARIRRP